MTVCQLPPRSLWGSLNKLGGVRSTHHLFISKVSQGFWFNLFETRKNWPGIWGSISRNILSPSCSPGEHWKGLFCGVRAIWFCEMQCAPCRLRLGIRARAELSLLSIWLSVFGAWNALWETSQVSQDLGLSNLSLPAVLSPQPCCACTT